MKKLAMLLFVLALCVPALGDGVTGPTDPDSTEHAVLVYKFTVQGSLAEFTDADYTDAELIREKVVGYIVADVDVATLYSFIVQVDDPDSDDPIITIDDVNDEPIFIVLDNYDKEFAVIREATDPNVEVDCNLATELEPIFNILNNRGADTGKDAVWAEFGLWVGGNLGYDYLGLDVGGEGVAKLSSAAVGRNGAKINVPKSIKGPGYLGLDSEFVYSYDGKGSCQLDTKYTKLANSGGRLNTKVAAALITDDLTDKHWTSKTIYQLFSD